MEILTSYLEQIEELATKENVSDTLRTLISKASKLAAGNTNGQFNSNKKEFQYAAYRPLFHRPPVGEACAVRGSFVVWGHVRGLGGMHGLGCVRGPRGCVHGPGALLEGTNPPPPVDG